MGAGDFGLRALLPAAPAKQLLPKVVAGGRTGLRDHQPGLAADDPQVNSHAPALHHRRPRELLLELPGVRTHALHSPRINQERLPLNHTQLIPRGHLLHDGFRGGFLWLNLHERLHVAVPNPRGIIKGNFGAGAHHDDLNVLRNGPAPGAQRADVREGRSLNISGAHHLRHSAAGSVRQKLGRTVLGQQRSVQRGVQLCERIPAFGDPLRRAAADTQRHHEGPGAEGLRHQGYAV